MNPIDLAVIAVYVTGCTALGAWLGSRSQGLKGYFLGESNIPTWAVMISIVATETSIVTFLSVPGLAYAGDFRFLQLAFGYLLGRVVVAMVLLPALLPRRDPHRLSIAPGPLRRADADDGVAPVPGGALARRRPAAVPRLDGARAPHRLAARGGHRGRGGDHHRLYLPRRDEGRDLDRRHPVQRLHPRRRGGPGDPGEQAPRRLGGAVPYGPRRRQVPAAGLLPRPDATLHVLGRTDRRHGPEYGDPRGRPDDGPARTSRRDRNARPPRRWWPAASSSWPSSPSSS